MDNLYRDWKIDGGDNVCILGGPRIQVATDLGSTEGFQGMTDIPSVYYFTVLLWVLFHSDAVSTVTDYQAVGPNSIPDIWAVVLGMYGTHLSLQSISFNNLGPWLTRV